MKARLWLVYVVVGLLVAGCGGGGGAEGDAGPSSNPPPSASNQPPTAGDVNLSTTSDTAVSGMLSGSDPDSGDTLTFAVETGPGNGSVTSLDERTGSFRYTPDVGFSGTDSFRFRVTDSSNASATATVRINVSAPDVDSVPTAKPDAATTNQGQSVVIDVLGNDLDLLDQPVTVRVAGAPEHGTLVVQSDNRIEYTPSIPNSTYLGSDSFIYEVQDGDGDVAMASVSISVECPTVSCSRTFEASWTPVSDSDVTGYCIYHDTDSGPPYTDRECVGEVTSYSWPLDVSVGTDFFAVTTTYSNGDESGFSREVTVNSF